MPLILLGLGSSALLYPGVTLGSADLVQQVWGWGRDFPRLGQGARHMGGVGMWLQRPEGRARTDLSPLPAPPVPVPSYPSSGSGSSSSSSSTSHLASPPVSRASSGLGGRLLTPARAPPSPPCLHHTKC